MKKLVFIVICVLFGLSSIAQNNPDNQNIDVIYTAEAAYEGGAEQLSNDLHRIINFSQEDINAGTSGVITVSFDVYPDKSIKDIVILSGINQDIDDEFKIALSAVKFEPARIDGNAIKSNVIMEVPVNAGYVK